MGSVSSMNVSNGNNTLLYEDKIKFFHHYAPLKLMIPWKTPIKSKNQ